MDCNAWIEGKKLGQVVDAHAVEVREGRNGGGTCISFERSTDELEGTFSEVLHTFMFILDVPTGDVDVSNVMLTKQAAIIIDMGGAKRDEHDTGMDCLRAVYAIVEMTMIPLQTNTYDEGPVNIKEYSSERKESVPMLLKEVARGKYEVPDKVRELVRFAVATVQDDTES